MKKINLCELIILSILLIVNIGYAQYTGDLCNGGNASASSVYSSYVASNAFDDNYDGSGDGQGGTYWSSNDPVPQWIKYDFGSGNEKVIKQYRFFTNYEDLYRPYSWKFQGTNINSNNNSDWTDIHSMNNITTSDNTWYTYNSSHFSNTNAYRYYRIYISDAHTEHSYVEIEEIEMMESSGTVPTVGTTTATSIEATSATLGGNISDTGGSSILERGVVYSTTDTEPEIDDPGVVKNLNGSGANPFNESIGSLTANTTYYFQAYATNSQGPSYGGVESFKTLTHKPTVTTQKVTNRTNNSATGNGNITYLGSTNPSAHGVCWSTSQNPTITDSHTNEGSASSTITFTSSITGLTSNTTYYLRAYATNASGTSYGEQVVFNTQYTDDLCTGGSASASSVNNSHVANLAFDNDFDGSGDGHGGTYWASNGGSLPEWIKYDFGSGSAKVIKQYRFFTNYEDLYRPYSWIFQGSNDNSNWTNIHTVNNVNTLDNSWYPYNTSNFSNDNAYRYYRIYISAAHTENTYIDIEEIEMMELLSINKPSVTTSSATSISTSSATLGGNVTSSGGVVVTERGIVNSSQNNDPTIGGSNVEKIADGSGTGSFSESVGSLTSNTKYWFQAYATNSGGTSYGGIEEFTTLSILTFVNGENAILNFVQSSPVLPAQNWPLGQFSMKSIVGITELTSIRATLGGTYTPDELQGTPFQLFASNSNDFLTAVSISGSFADPGSGNDLIFSSLTDDIPSTTRYYWITADIAAGANGSIHATIDNANDITITAGVLSGSSFYGKLNADEDASLPVELSSFTAIQEKSNVLLRWITESEVNNLGFNIYRSTDQNGEFEILNDLLISGAGNSSIKNEYFFIDNEVIPEQTYYYQIEDIASDGKSKKHDIISITIKELESNVADSFKLYPAYPNPFNPQTNIRYSIAKESHITLSIYDIRGNIVKTLISESKVSGNYDVIWNGTDEHNQQVCNGIYFYQLQSNSGFSQTAKIIFMK